MKAVTLQGRCRTVGGVVGRGRLPHATSLFLHLFLWWTTLNFFQLQVGIIFFYVGVERGQQIKILYPFMPLSTNITYTVLRDGLHRTVKMAVFTAP